MAVIKKNTLFLIKIAIFAAVTRALFACAYYFHYIRASKMPLYSFDGESGSVISWYIALLLKGVNVLSLPMRFIPVDPWVSDRMQVIIASFDCKLPPPITYGVGAYSYFLGLFYYIFGYAPLLFRLFNISVSIATAFLCYRLAMDNFGEKAARISFVIMLFLPYQFLYSASLQRDTIINFLCVLAVFSALSIGMFDKLLTKVALTVLLAVSIAILYPLRFSACFMILASLAIYLITIIYHKYKRLFIVGAVMFMSVPAVQMKIFHFFKSKIGTLLTHHISFASYGGSAYKLFSLKYYIFFNPAVCPSLSDLSFWETVTVIVLSLKAFLLEPILYHDFKTSYLFALPEMIVWYFVLIFSLLGAIYAFRKMDVRRLGLMICVLIFSLVIGMSGANMDALIRHRGMISFVYVIFAAYGLSVIDDIVKKARS